MPRQDIQEVNVIRTDIIPINSNNSFEFQFERYLVGICLQFVPDWRIDEFLNSQPIKQEEEFATNLTAPDVLIFNVF